MTEAVQLRYPVNVLASFHYFAGVDMSLLSAGGLRVVGDSGAFSALSQGATIDPDEYVAWVEKWHDHLCWAAGLDVIGDAEGTWSNWLDLASTGREFVPTIHYGSPPQAIDRYVDRGVDFIGLGGMVARKSEPARLLRWALSVFRYAKANHPQVRFHGWGVTHPLLLSNLPWYSVDSSGWGSAYRYARLKLYDGEANRPVTIALNGRDIYKHGQLVREFGVEPADIAKSGPANRPLLVRLSAASFQRLEDRLRRRAHVTAPRFGLHRPGPEGPNVHLAGSGLGGEFEHLAGPHMHLADSDKDNLPKLTDPGPHLHAALCGSKWEREALADPGPHLHLADAGPHILKELQDGPHLHLATSNTDTMKMLRAEGYTPKKRGTPPHQQPTEEPA